MLICCYYAQCQLIILNRRQSFLLGNGSFLLALLGSLVLSFLLDILVLVDNLLVGVLLGSNGSLSLLDLADGFLSEGLLIFGTCSFDLFNIFKSDSLNSSLFSEEFFLLVFALIGLFQFLMESSPSSSPSKSLGFEFSK
jgi:hypothetical protein